MENKIESFNDKLSNIRKKLPQSLNQYADFGKLQPQLIEVEEAVLGSIMLESDAIYRVTELRPEHFYREENKTIFKAIQTLNSEGKPVDLITVTNQLRTESKLDLVGGAFYITELTNRVGSSANIVFHVKLLIEQFIKREVIRICNKYLTEAFEDTTDCFELYENLFIEISQITMETEKGNASTIPEVLSEIFEEIGLVKQGHTFNIQSCFNWVNKELGGYRNQEIIIVAGRPGAGKSAFAIQEAAYISKREPVLFFNIDMTKKEVVKRMLSADTEINYHYVHNCDFSDNEIMIINKSVSNIEKSKLYIYDKSVTIDDIILITNKYKNKYKIKLVVIDHFSLIKTKSKDRISEMRDISNRLKLLAKDTDLPFIVLAQMNRDIEKTKSRKPQLSDLRDTGATEEDADKVIFSWRPEKQGLKEVEFHDETISTSGICMFVVAKNRQGEITDFTMNFKAQFQKFIEGNDYDLSRKDIF